MKNKKKRKKKKKERIGLEEICISDFPVLEK